MTFGSAQDDHSTYAEVAHYQVAASAENHVWDRARVSEADDLGEFRDVVGDGKQVGRSADTHRRVSGERLIEADANPEADTEIGRDGCRFRRGPARRRGGRVAGHEATPLESSSMRA